MVNLERSVEALIHQGYTLAIRDSEGSIVKRTGDVATISSTLGDIEEGYLKVWEGSIKGVGYKGFILLVEDEVCDYSDNEHMAAIVSNYFT
jgi:hypothetical protein